MYGEKLQKVKFKYSGNDIDIWLSSQDNYVTQIKYYGGVNDGKNN